MVLSALAPSSMNGIGQWGCDRRLRCLQDADRRCGGTEDMQPAMAGGDGLVMVSAGTKEIAELVVASTEPRGRSGTLEAPHTSYAAFYAPMVLFKPVIL